jgi:hypothetical protein
MVLGWLDTHPEEEDVVDEFQREDRLGVKVAKR